MGTAILISSMRTRLGPDDRGYRLENGRLLRGIDLYPGKPAKIDDEDLAPLLAWGNGLGEHLRKHEVLLVEFDRASVIGREQRIADFVRLATQLRALESTMSEDERRAAIAKIMARENELRGGRPEGSASDAPPAPSDASAPPAATTAVNPTPAAAPNAEPPVTPAAPATAQGDTEPVTTPSPTLSVETIGTMTFAQLEPLVRGSTDVELLDSLLQAEQAGKNRKTVVELLEDRWTELAASKE